MDIAEAVGRPYSAVGSRPHARAGENLITLGLGFWILAGWHLDAAAHSNFFGSGTEGFFSPWHAVVYSGFVASAAWMTGLTVRHMRAGRTGLAAVPFGYELGLAGVGFFALGGLTDMIWHIFNGFENGSEALLTGTHAGLFLGTFLIVSTPFRAAWAASDGGQISLRKFLPALLSLAFGILALTLAFAYLWPFYYDQHKLRLYFLWLLRDIALPVSPIAVALTDLSIRSAASHILLANLVLLAPILALLRRWHPPFGTFTIFFTLTTGGAYELLPAVLLAGLITDALAQMLSPSVDHVGAFRLFAGAVPVVLWGLYLAAIYSKWQLRWPATIAMGVVVWAALSGLGLSVLMTLQATRTGAGRPVRS